MSKLLLIPFLFDAADILLTVGRALSSTFDSKVQVVNCLIDVEYTCNRERNQYHSTSVIRHILKRFQSDGEKILGITSVDLYVPVLTFVFGEAQLGGPAAVVSTYRLKNDLYGLPQDRNLLQERLIKESVHELGHTFGLVHCSSQECVMHSSTYVEEIDFKPSSFCPSCKKNFNSNSVQKPSFARVANQ